MQDDILAADTRSQLAIDLDPHILTPLSDEGLSGENVFDFTRSDAESESTECAMGGRVAVSTDEGSAGKSETLLWANDMNDALSLVVQSEKGELKVSDVFLQSNALRPRLYVLDETGHVFQVGT
jgi:hypothetical protein